MGPVIATLPADGPATTIGSTRLGNIAIGFGIGFHSVISGGHHTTGSGLLFTYTGLTTGARIMVGGATGAVNIKSKEKNILDFKDRAFYINNHIKNEIKICHSKRNLPEFPCRRFEPETVISFTLLNT